MIGFYIARLRDFYCADRTRFVWLFFLFLCSKEEKKICPLARSLFSCWKESKTRGKEKKWKWEKTLHIKKNIYKNVAARALRKTSVLSFRVHHARDTLVMNRWRFSVFLIWTRMYLYITVYSPLLFCVFFSSSSSCFFWDSCKRRFLPSRSKKEKEERESFFFVSPPSLFSRPFGAERDKKKALFFFFSCPLFLKQQEHKTTTKKEKYLLQSSVVFLDSSCRTFQSQRRIRVLVCSRQIVCFVSRGEREREKGTTKKPKKGKKILSLSV